MTTFEFNDVLPSAGPEGLPEAALEKLQCNILHSASGARSTQVFRRFANQREMATWLVNMPSPSNAARQDGPLANVLFTRAGLGLLNAPRQSLKSEGFNRGARNPETLAKLGDGSAEDWREHQKPWHIVELYVHGTSGPSVPPSSDYVVEHGRSIGADGKELSDAKASSYGHFGVKDGISRHAYTQADFEHLQPPPTGLGSPSDPRRRLSTLLVHDEFAASADAFGSFFVFRKYEQDIELFRARIAELRQAHVIDGLEDSDDSVKQQMFGRDSEGRTPFGATHDFHFENDPQGETCPFHAHIRKMNPRGATGDLEDERSRSIARRGTSYTSTDINHQSRQEKGLLFWCAQARIEDQFEHIQAVWANGQSDTSLAPMPDADPLIGQLDPRLLATSVAPGTTEATSRWSRWKETTSRDYNVWKAVKLRGAEYCYAPSLEGIAALKKHAQSCLEGSPS